MAGGPELFDEDIRIFFAIWKYLLEYSCSR